MSALRLAFVLRVWSEPDAAGEHAVHQMRGSLQLVSSDEIRYFSELETIAPIVRELLEQHETRAQRITSDHREL